MVQWVKTLASKPDDLTSIPGTTWWKERTNSLVLFSGLFGCTMTHPPPLPHKYM